MSTEDIDTDNEIILLEDEIIEQPNEDFLGVGFKYVPGDPFW